MAIDNINTQASIAGGIEALNRPGAEDASSGSVLSENFDWFNVSDGKALPISAQAQFGDTSTMDEMLSAMRGHLGI